MRDWRQLARNLRNVTELARRTEGLPVWKSARRLGASVVRGMILQQGKSSPKTIMPAAHEAAFDWTYARQNAELQKLYIAAKRGQWDSDRDLDWSTSVDPLDPERELIADEALPLCEIPAYRALDERTQRGHRHALLAWLLSQFLHGEQGALLAACQVTEAVRGFDSKLYGSTQVVDEGRHVEVFSRYLDEKLERRYEINDNLFVVIDSLMRDSRWDMKFLGMQIMIEGLALGAFGTTRQNTKEPLLAELLRYVITDEARHVHYGVVSLASFYKDELTERERREREDQAFETCVLLRNRFLAHEFYDEFYAHLIPRPAWDELVLASRFMRSFRASMFRRIVPNLKRIHLLPARLRPHYEALGLLLYEDAPIDDDAHPLPE